MLIQLYVKNIDDNIVQPGESVTVGNFIWAIYTTVSKEDWQKYFSGRAKKEKNNEEGDDTGPEAEGPQDENPEDDAEDNNVSYDDGPSFLVYVECKPIDPTMSFECVADINFVEHCDFYGSRSKDHTVNQVFNDTDFQSGMVGTYWECNKSKAFTVDLNVKSFEIFPTRCFTSPKPNLTDIELIVGDKTFYASKHILAQHSKKFYEMIYGGDQSVDRLEIKDVSPEEFLLFLEALYDCEKGVRWSSIEKLVDLANLFKSTKCLRKCEIFLIRQNVCHSSNWDHNRSGIVFKYSVQFGFKILQKHLIHSISSYKLRNVLENQELYSLGLEVQDILTARLKQLKIEEKKEESEPGYWEHREKIRALKESNNVHPFIDMMDQASIDFSIPRDNQTDIALSVGDKKYHISKQILANASTYFNAMFYRNFNEKNETDIELKEIDTVEFEEFLQHVYNPERSFNDFNIEYLVRLCHFFNASYNLRQCQKYILHSIGFNDAQKVHMAKKYHLTYLFDQVVFKYQTMNDFKRFSLLDDFNKLDTSTIGEMALKILEHHTGTRNYY